MLGFMLTTAFISMWITNTATTAMMTPIMEAVLKQLDEEYFPEKHEAQNDIVQNPNVQFKISKENGRMSVSTVSDGDMIEMVQPCNDDGGERLNR